MSRDLVYRAFTLYYGNLPLTKINTTEEQHATYAAKMYSLLAEPRYLIVICYQDFLPKNTVKRLSEVKWESFQTRVLKSDLGIEEQSIPRENNGVFDDQITVYKRDKSENKVVYQALNVPLIVELVAGKKGSIVDFPDKATLEGALETFQCVVYFA
jgi:hypothetical protein